MTSRNATALAMVAAAGMATGALARPDFPEIEPNETKAQALANGAFTLAAGDSVSGTTTGSSTTVAGAASADTFLIKTGALALGIYRHRLVLTTTGTTGHAGTIRGLNQTAPVAGPWPGPLGTAGVTDTTIQTSVTTTTPSGYQWYGFGKGEQIYYRVTGAATTTANYTATLTTDAVTPSVMPAVEAGTVAFDFSNQGHTTDTDIWIYDSTLTPIAGYGNDDRSLNSGSPYTTTALQSYLKRTYPPGTYYMAVSTFQAQSNLTSPCDDNFGTGSLLDFPDAQSNTSATANVNVAFQVTDSNGTAKYPLTRVDPFGVAWVQFTVGTGITGACCLPDGTCGPLSATGCGSAGGIYNGDGTSCGTITCPPTGSCCLPTTNTCVQTFATFCTAQGGVFTPGASCAVGCPSGACCLPDGTCRADLIQAACVFQAGTWNPGTSCGTFTCPTPGACCLSDGSCVVMTPSQCSSQSGVFQGPGSVCATGACFTAPVLWDNGPLATGTVAGNGTVAPAGFQWSECSNDGTTTCANTSAGFTCTQASFRMADNFTISAPTGWNVTTVNFYAYVSGSTATTSPFTAAGGTLRIWNGRPGDATSTVVFGDATTNRLGVSTDPALYRVFNTTTPPPGTATGTTRRLWRNEMTVGTVLPPGTYWVDVGTSAAAFAPTNTHKGVRNTPFTNARQLAVATGLWAEAIDTGNPAVCPDVQHDMPFEVVGSVVTPPAACYANCDNSTLPPCLNVNDFNCFLNAYGAGDSYANCDLSTLPPILNVNDFQCFLNAYSASCPDPCAAH